MPAGAGQSTPNAGGSPRTMFLGMGVVAAGLAAFYLVQMRVHKNDKQNWIVRHGEPSGNQTLAVPQVGSGPLESESHPPSMPLPGNEDKRAGGLGETVMSAVLGRGVNPEPSVPENPENMQVPTPQRRSSSGATYTKAANYVDSYKPRPNASAASKEGRS